MMVNSLGAVQNAIDLNRHSAATLALFGAYRIPARRDGIWFAPLRDANAIERAAR